MNVGDLVARFLRAADVDTVFAIISVHNIPILDGIARQGGIRVVMTRGETGASHMADGFARIAGTLGVLISSTGPGAANTVPGLLEASAAGTPLLHITGQVPSHIIGRDIGATHNVKDQLGMLASVCKAAYRVRTAGEAWGILTRAATQALAIGAACAAKGQQTILLSGDAGFVMHVCELWTAKQESLDLLMVVMNDAGYGVIKHMQDAAFGGCRVYGGAGTADTLAGAAFVGSRYARHRRSASLLSIFARATKGSAMTP